MTTSAPTVLIIGAGPAGIGAIEQFKRKGFDVVAYDARSVPGGLWNPTVEPPPCTVSFDADGLAIALSPFERSGKPAPVPGPVYPSIKANTPRDIMNFRGHPYPDGTAFLPSQEAILAYLQDHSRPYLDHIRFNRYITRVRWTHPSGEQPVGQKKWTVEWTPSITSSESNTEGPITTEQFDHVVVANGSDTKPYIPYFDGLWDWKGEILHSRWYRQARDYAGKTVVVVGNGPSGSDIARELALLLVDKSPLAPNKVYQSIRSPPRYDIELERNWKDHVQTLGPIKLFNHPSKESANGRLTTFDGVNIDDVDIVIFATSFLIAFPFIHDEDAPFNKFPVIKHPSPPKGSRKPPAELVGDSDFGGGHRVHNLDEHSLFYYPDPSLVFLLLHAEAIPWPFSELQARVVAAYWSGTPFDINPYPDEESESHSILVLGHPGEFIYAENLLQLIGEGGEEEISADGKWGKWPAWKKEIRAAID